MQGLDGFLERDRQRPVSGLPPAVTELPGRPKERGVRRLLGVAADRTVPGPGRDLLEQRGYTSRIASLAASQITGGDITSIRIDDKVELAPSAVLGRLAHVPAMNLDAGTVHEDVTRSVMAGPVERDLAESLGTSREGCLAGRVNDVETT